LGFHNATQSSAGNVSEIQIRQRGQHHISAIARGGAQGLSQIRNTGSHIAFLFGVSTAIGDYAIIGDCRSAALISKSGALDWLCLPHFSSPAIFGALLDQQRGGRFQISPSIGAGAVRRYLPNTNVLETTFRTADGVVRLIDMMSIPSGTGLEPMAEVLRVVEGVAGTVPIRFEIQPEPDYGRIAPRLRQCSRRHWAWTWRDECLHLGADVIFQPSGSKLVADHVVTAGQRLCCSLAYVKRDIGVIPGLGTAAERRLESTIRWWETWCARARYDGPYPESVRRSALTLKLLTYALSGAIVAAPSASLPEHRSRSQLGLSLLLASRCRAHHARFHPTWIF
jgi:GH15 family glucan-1,4-alpha-glucosidase